MPAAAGFKGTSLSTGGNVMERRKLGAGLVAFACGLFLMAGTAMAHGASPAGTEAGTCHVKTLPAFVAQGEFETTATVADVIEVGCDPMLYGTGSKIKVIDSQLYSRCGEKVTWYVPNPYSVSYGNGVVLTLDADGNATVLLIAGPRCQAGETLVTVHELEEPFESFTESFTVLPPNDTEEGLYIEPPSQIEDSESSGVGTIVEAEFPGKSEEYVRFGSEELYARCREYPHVHWITENGSAYTNTGEITEQRLDDNGNVFVLAIGDSSCYPGESLIEADLEDKPFTTLTTMFNIESPKPRF
jgi:hypothetical protein